MRTCCDDRVCVDRLSSYACRGPSEPFLTALMPVHEAAAAGVWALMAGGSGPEALPLLPFLGDRNASASGAWGSV